MSTGSYRKFRVFSMFSLRTNHGDQWHAPINPNGPVKSITAINVPAAISGSKTARVQHKRRDRHPCCDD
jgi:hypothetical protein